MDHGETVQLHDQQTHQRVVCVHDVHAELVSNDIVVEKAGNEIGHCIVALVGTLFVPAEQT